MGDKPEVLEAVLKETVDLVMDLETGICKLFLIVVGEFCFCCYFVVYGIFLIFQENIPIEEVFENLRCTKDGLTSEAAQERLAIFGYNKLEEKKVLIC